VPTLFQPLPILQVRRLPVCLCDRARGEISKARRRDRPRVGQRRSRQRQLFRLARASMGKAGWRHRSQVSNGRGNPKRGRKREPAKVKSHRHGASTRGETLREKVLRDLASRAATDAGFLKQARRDLEGTLAGFGYELTLEELRLVEDLRRRTAAMSDEQLARTLASGLRGRTGRPPARPSAPSWRGAGPTRPARAGS
jgi:hypothetical protein